MATVFRAPLLANPHHFRKRYGNEFGFVAGFTAAILTALAPIPADTTHLPHSLSQDKPWAKATVLRSVSGSPRALLSAPVQAPFSQKDWPNPRGPLPARQGDSSGFDAPILTYAVGLNTPNQRQIDWPNPRGAKPNQVLGFVSGGFLSAPVVAPFFETEWPVPRGAKANQALSLTSEGLSRSTTVVAPPADTTTLPHALVHDAAWQRATSFTSVYGSTRLLSTAVIAAPFFETDWPNPRGPQRSIDALTWTQNLQQTTLGPPFKQTNWPNPTGAQPARQAETSGFDTTIRAYADGLNTANNPKPDWPNPRGPAPRSIDALTWTQSLAAQYVAAAVKPFLQSDWPLPVPRVYRQIADTTGFPAPILNYAVGLNTAAKPQFDWPNPRGPARSIDALTWTQSLVAEYTSLGTKPFLQTDWPLPVPRVYRQIANSTGFTTPILNYAVGLNTPNQRQLDWPNPRGPARSIDALTWTQEGLARPTTVAAIVPFVQTDWPLPIPRVYRQIAETRGFEQPILGYAVGLNDANKRKSDWPVPQGRPPLNVGYASGFAEPVRFAHVSFANLRNYDWPVPKGRPPLNVGYASGFAEPVRVAHVPFANLRKYDWPNPRGPQRSIDALTWKIYLQQSTLPPTFFTGGPADEPERIICVPGPSREADVPALLRSATVPVQQRTATVPELLRVATVPDDSRVVNSNDYRDERCHDT